MATQTVCVGEETRQELLDLAEQTGKTIEALVGEAVKELRRKVFLEGLNADFAALKANPEAWQEEVEERKLSENTLMDGLEAEEPWPADN